MLYPLSDFIDDGATIAETSPTYWYEGICSQTGILLRLPRTSRIEAIAAGLMAHLATDAIFAHEGKMYGVLLVQTPTGKEGILKAFSGLLKGQSIVEGWVPPIPGRDDVAGEEADTLTSLDRIKLELLILQNIPERQHYRSLHQEYENGLHKLTLCHQQRKQERQQQRYDNPALKIALDRQSQLDGIERKRFKQERDEALKPLQAIIEQADTRIRELKQQRKILSRNLQTQMHSAYSLTNFSGRSVSLEQLMGVKLPTGTGDCCAPKLLHYAATRGLKPLAMAEFWWGEANLDKVRGEFYGACVERCQPLMGFLLSGLSQTDLKFIYEDESLIAVDKPAGLLSVPGRYRETQGSVLSRLRHRFPEVMAVHRLDGETSGILLLAKDLSTYRILSRQFQDRRIHKVYEALLKGDVTEDDGTIALPLWGNPEKRPYQVVDRHKGKSSVTHFRVIDKEKEYTRIEFYPLTGRTHQIRVHAASPDGLGCPILGDRLYGDPTTSSRLHLHARELRFEHPQTHQILHLRSDMPF